MIFWHVGATVFLFRWIFRDPGVDLRFLAFGAVLSDLIDKPLGRILFADTYRTGRVYGHTMVFAVVVMTIGMIATRRATVARRRAITLSVGVFFHLLLDGMWTMPETLFWPLFGVEFPPGPEDYWSGLIGRLLDQPVVLVQELVGLLYLLYLWNAAGLRDPAARRRLRETGRITVEAGAE